MPHHTELMQVTMISSFTKLLNHVDFVGHGEQHGSFNQVLSQSCWRWGKRLFYACAMSRSNSPAEWPKGQEYLLTGQGLTIVMIFNDIDVVSHHFASISANQIQEFPEFPESQIQILPPFVHFEVGFQPLKIFGWWHQPAANGCRLLAESGWNLAYAPTILDSWHSQAQTEKLPQRNLGLKSFYSMYSTYVVFGLMSIFHLLKSLDMSGFCINTWNLLSFRSSLYSPHSTSNHNLRAVHESWQPKRHGNTSIQWFSLRLPHVLSWLQQLKGLHFHGVMSFG